MVGEQCLLSVGGGTQLCLESLTLGSESPGSESQLVPFLVRLWVHPVMSQNLSFLCL